MKRANKARAQKAAIASTSEPTYWNYERCRAVRCIVLVEDGRRLAAVEIDNANQAGSQPFYIEDEDGSGWRKVTTGRGSPGWPSTGPLPVVRVIERAKS